MEETNEPMEQQATESPCLPQLDYQPILPEYDPAKPNQPKLSPILQQAFFMAERQLHRGYCVSRSRRVRPGCDCLSRFPMLQSETERTRFRITYLHILEWIIWNHQRGELHIDFLKTIIFVDRNGILKIKFNTDEGSYFCVEALFEAISHLFPNRDQSPFSSLKRSNATDIRQLFYLVMDYYHENPTKQYIKWEDIFSLYDEPSRMAIQSKLVLKQRYKDHLHYINPLFPNLPRACQFLAKHNGMLLRFSDKEMNLIVRLTKSVQNRVKKANTVGRSQVVNEYIGPIGIYSAFLNYSYAKRGTSPSGIAKDNQEVLEALDQKIKEQLHSPTGPWGGANRDGLMLSHFSCYLSALLTIGDRIADEPYQRPHKDVPTDRLPSKGEDLIRHPCLGFVPSSQSGMFLQIWPPNSRHGDPTTHYTGEVVYVPSGFMLFLPGDVMHGGGFTTALDGNPRLHFVFFSAPAADVLFKNEYRHPYSSTEYSEYCYDCPHLDKNKLSARLFRIKGDIPL